MTEIIYLLPLNSQILKDNRWLLPACYAKGDITIENKKYKNAIFLCLEGIQGIINDYNSLEECLQDLIVHEIIHEITDWEHDFEGIQKIR